MFKNSRGKSLRKLICQKSEDFQHLPLDLDDEDLEGGASKCSKVIQTMWVNYV